MGATSLSELLQKKQASYEAEAAKNKELIDEWIDAIGKLFLQLRGWLAISDPTNILHVDETRDEVEEPNVGRYQAPRMNIRAFGKWVGILPKARKTVGAARPPQAGAPSQATGRVDITDEVRRYVLYRSDDKETWFIQGPSDSPRELTKERFEEALASYFQ